MQRSRFVVIGLGNIGTLLIKMLSRDFDLICIDSDPEAIASVEKLNYSHLKGVLGDATSRMVLEEAGVAGADTVIITTTTEKYTIEIARVLHEKFNIPRVIAMGITRDGINQLESLGAEVENIFNISATVLRNRLDVKTKAVLGVGLEKNEILEVEVNPSSALANKPLSALNLHNWQVGIIYREGNILLPRGNTVIKPRDRLIILGYPQTLQSAVEVLTSRSKEFPLRYGDCLTALLQGDEKDAFFEELGYIFSLLPLKKTLLIHLPNDPDYRDNLRKKEQAAKLGEVQILAADNLMPANLNRMLSENGCRAGLLVLPKQDLTDGRLSLFAKSKKKFFLLDLASEIQCPLVLAGGTFPYEKVAVPCISVKNMQHALETTLAVSTAINFEVSALLSKPAKYISTPEEEDGFQSIKKTISELSHSHRRSIKMMELEGNPIRIIPQALKAFSLAVGEIGAWNKHGVLHSLIWPDVEWKIMRDSPVSTLLLPSHDLNL
jgi:Trk K+ transport system NAD-binding subunit